MQILMEKHKACGEGIYPRWAACSSPKNGLDTVNLYTEGCLILGLLRSPVGINPLATMNQKTFKNP
jgi:hypothetical protein